MKLVNICICIYALLKPYYISSSGTIQIADLFIVLAFILVVLLKLTNKVKSSNIVQTKPLMLFVCMVLIINNIYFLVYGTRDFLISSLHYIFVLIGSYVFYNVLDYNYIISNINKILKINIIIQFIIFLLGVGREYFGVRYMGTFNDPNQFGFYIFLTFLITRVIDKIENKQNKLYWFFLIIVAFLIIKSVSTGMILGFGIFLLLNVLVFFKNIFKYIIEYRKHIFIIGIIAILLMFFIMSLYYVDEEFKMKINNKIEQVLESSLVKRLKEKFEKFSINTKGGNFLEDRGLDKIILYPENLLYGAGQGCYSRFEGTKNTTIEIHSTLPGILFYYGIIPFGLLIYWIWINIRNLKFNQYIPYMAILIESFTLLNQRQLLLWFMIILANKYVEREDKGEINSA